MPGCLFRSGSTVFVLPDKVSMGSVFDGLRCAVIQYMTVHGTDSTERISQRLSTPVNKMREVFRSMEDDGTIVMLNSGGRMMPFLCDRYGWMDRMRHDEVMKEMARYRRIRQGAEDRWDRNRQERIIREWTGRDSNSRPLQCQCSDLPTDLPAQLIRRGLI